MPIPRMLERMGGLQAQYAPSMYIGLWSRLDGFERDALTRALEARSVDPGDADAQHHPPRLRRRLLAARGRRPRGAARRRGCGRRARSSSAAEMEAAAERLRAALAGGATLRRKEIDALLGKTAARGVGLWVDLVRAPPSGTWERRRADLYALADDWIEPAPTSPATTPSSTSSAATSAPSGPATVKDVASFTGLAATELARARRASSCAASAPSDGEELLDLPRAPLPDPDTPAPVRFLGTWDASLLVHARRTGVLPEEHRPRIFHTRRRSRSRPSSSTARSPAPGATRRARSTSRRSAASTPRPPRARRRGASGSRRCRVGRRGRSYVCAPTRPLVWSARGGYVPLMLDVRRLRVLREVARRGSLAGAAEVLSYTPSAVSQQIAVLEREAGTRLLGAPRARRRAHGGGPDAGRARRGDPRPARRRRGGARRARRPAARAPADGLVRDRRRERRCRARSTRSARAIPAIELTVGQASPHESVARLRDGRLDIALTVDLDARPAEGVEVIHLFEDRLRLALHRDHPLAAKRRGPARGPRATRRGSTCPPRPPGGQTAAPRLRARRLRPARGVRERRLHGDPRARRRRAPASRCSPTSRCSRRTSRSCCARSAPTAVPQHPGRDAARGLPLARRLGDARDPLRAARRRARLRSPPRRRPSR